MKKILTYFLNTLASMKLTVFILSVIAVLIILQAASGRLITTFEHWNWLRVIASIDIYHSKGLIILLVSFCINLIACSIKRLPKTVNLFSQSSKELDDNLITSLPLVERFKAKNHIESSEKISPLIATHFKKPTLVKKVSGQINLYAEKGRYTHLGFYLAHISILGIVLGVMLSTTGYQSTFKIRKDQVLDPLVVNLGKGKKKTLNFSLLFEDFKTIYYQETSKIKKHQSKLTILKDGKKVKTQMVDFGHPLRYKGIDIYQRRFNEKVKYAKIKVVLRNGESEVYDVKNGDSFTVRGTGIRIRASRFESDSLQLKKYFSFESILISNTPVSFPDKHLKDYKFSLIEIMQKEVISLKIINDPGKGVIWYSFFSMLFGFCITFFFSHQRIWANVEEKEGECTIILAGSATKNVQTLEGLFNTIQNELSKV